MKMKGLGLSPIFILFLCIKSFLYFIVLKYQKIINDYTVGFQEFRGPFPYGMVWVSNIVLGLKVLTLHVGFQYTYVMTSLVSAVGVCLCLSYVGCLLNHTCRSLLVGVLCLGMNQIHVPTFSLIFFFFNGNSLIKRPIA
jgi:inner membrane protein involved in colicin E2 resistance